MRGAAHGSRRRRRCRYSVRMSAHAPHRHITHTRPDASRSLPPPRPLPRACSPRPTRSAARARQAEHARADERDDAGRSAASAAATGRSPRPQRSTAMHITVTAKKPARHWPRADAAAAVSPCGTRRPPCASLRGCGRRPPPRVSHPSPCGESARRRAGRSDMPGARSPDRQTARSAKARSASCCRFPLRRPNENRPHKAAGSAVATRGSAQWPSSSSSSA